MIGYMENDAAQFAAWDVDYVKLDGCYAHPSEMDQGKLKRIELKFLITQSNI